MVPRTNTHKKEVNNHLSISLMILIVFLGIMWMTTYYHEAAHREIYISYGCQNITMIANPLYGRTTCHDPIKPYPNMISEHNWNDIIGYTATSIIMSVYFIWITNIFINKLNKRGMTRLKSGYFCIKCADNKLGRTSTQEDNW